MSRRPKYSDSYKLERAITYGATGGIGLIFSFLLLMFLNSIYHSFGPTDTVDEMIMYAEFFLFAAGSYFVAAVLIWRLRKLLSPYVVSWLAISALGSLIFCLTFFTRVWVGSVLTYREGDPFRQPPGSYSGVIFLALLATPILTCIAMLFTAVASQLYRSNENDSELHFSD